ncbi:MAG: nucleotide exchange factor GrpE [Muribaculaceae bacterium]
MDNDKSEKEEVEVKAPETQEPDTEQPIEQQDEPTEMEQLQAKYDELSAQIEKEKKEYLFLMAEFDNFRKRTLKEKSDLIKNGAESAMKALLPIIDDFERGVQANDNCDDIAVLKDGMNIIYNKFVKYLEQNGVKPIATDAGADFDTELHEAVTVFPTDDEKLKGKVIDTVQKGYMLNDKVLRHSKVVVGQ